MNTNPHQDALRSRWTLEGTIPLSGVADGAVWHRARSVATGEAVTLFIVRGEAALETADAVRRAYLVEDERLMPVHEVVVLDDPREDGPSSGPGAADSDHADEDAHPTTVVEYPLPPAPPLAAMLGKGVLHPETARAVIGEAAMGLEVARRRGLRHQFLDSNRIFVDPRTGVVKVLGVGVEAASHPGLDRSREVASFQDTAALTALLYRALTGHSPRPDENGEVPKPSAVVADGAPQIPADLDLLCELVLNETSEEIPETTRGLIAALEPWQSIPVTLEAYRSHGEQASRTESASPKRPTAGAEGGGGSAGAGAESGASGLAAAAAASGAVAGGGAAADGTAAEGAAPAAAPSPGGTATGDAASSDDSSSDLDEDGLESTALMAAVPDDEDEDERDGEDAASSVGAGPDTGAGTDAATGTVAGPGSEPGPGADSRAHAEGRPDGTRGTGFPHEDTSAQGAGSDGSGEDAVAAEGEAAQQQAAHSSADAQAIVRDLQLDQKRSSSAFPGHLDLTVPHPPVPAPEETSPASRQHPAQSAPQAHGDHSASAAAGSAGGIADSGGAIAQGPGAAEPAETAEGSEAAIPSRRSGTHWPLASGSDPAEQEELAPRATEPIRPSPDPNAPGHRDGTPAAASAQTPSAAVHPGPGAASPTPVTVTGRSDSVSAVPSEGPIVVQGRQHRPLEDLPIEAAQPSPRSTLLREVISVAVDSDDPDAYAMGASQPEQRSRQSQWILLGAVLVVIVALVFAVSTITSGLRERVENPLNTEPVASAPATEEETTEEEPTEEEPTEEEELPPAELDGVELLVEGSDSDPDNLDQVDRITDGDPGTFWSTQHYTSPQYGGLKEGVGVRIDLAEESTLSAVVVTTARNSGGTLELRAVGEDDSLGETLASGEFAGDGEVRLEPDEPVEAERVALWLSELPSDSNEAGRFRGRIAEIQVE